MRNCCWILTSLFVSGALIGQDDWERVYSESDAIIEEARLLCVEVDEKDVMIGSEQGRVIVDFDDLVFAPLMPEPFEESHAHLLQLNVEFDVLSIGKVEGGWVIGGPSGQVAYSLFQPEFEGPPPLADVWGDDDRAEFAQSWQNRRIDSAGDITRLEGNGERVVALSNGKLYLSKDRGDTWSRIPGQSGVRDLEAFRGAFYILSQFTTEYKHNIELQRSEDGEIWESMWIAHDVGELFQYLNLRPLSLSLDGESNVEVEGMRLNVYAYYEHQMSFSSRTLRLSSVDGETWQDIGSYRAFWANQIGGNHRSSLNPLNLPDSQRFLSYPALKANPHSWNYSVKDNRLERFEKDGWTTKLTTHPEERATSVSVAIWDELVLISDTFDLMRITESDETSMQAGPRILNWRSFVSAGGVYYILVEHPSYDVGTKVLISDDLETWSDYQLEGRIQYWNLKAAGNQVGLFFGIPEEPPGNAAPNPTSRDVQRGLKILGDEEAEPILMPPNRQDVAILPASNQWYSLWHDASHEGDDGNVHIEVLNESGEHAELTAFAPETWNGYFKHLDAPDGERLIAYGDSAEVALIESDGSVRLVHPWKQFPSDAYRIDKVSYVNGWYYLIGDVTVMTQDFESFALLEGPLVSEPVSDVQQFGSDLYVIAGGTLFHKPLDLGYLDSVLRQQGWRQSTWLGWFTIIDEDENRIHHLQLGETAVTRIGGGNYLLDTAELGELKIRTDWMPWVQRESDGHWLWLDMKSWPVRVWDDTEGIWLDL